MGTEGTEGDSWESKILELRMRASVLRRELRYLERQGFILGMRIWNFRFQMWQSSRLKSKMAFEVRGWSAVEEATAGVKEFRLQLRCWRMCTCAHIYWGRDWGSEGSRCQSLEWMKGSAQVMDGRWTVEPTVQSFVDVHRSGTAGRARLRFWCIPTCHSLLPSS